MGEAMGEAMGDDLRAQFVDEACAVLYDGFDNNRREFEDRPAGGTWSVLQDEERRVARAAMGRLLDWLDTRRF